MRELEFLPPWYPQLRVRKRRIALQGWISLLIIAGLGLWLFMISRNTAEAKHRLEVLDHELSQSKLELEKLGDMESLQAQLRVQEQVLARIGLHVEMTRLMNAIEEAMSVDMALLELTMRVNEQKKMPTGLAAAVRNGQKPETTIDRRLEVKLRGVAPTDVELANFLFKLTNNPLFETVTLNYARERHERAHIMREFEVSFSINLNQREG